MPRDLWVTAGASGEGHKITPHSLRVSRMCDVGPNYDVYVHAFKCVRTFRGRVPGKGLGMAKKGLYGYARPSFTHV